MRFCSLRLVLEPTNEVYECKSQDCRLSRGFRHSLPGASLTSPTPPSRRHSHSAPARSCRANPPPRLARSRSGPGSVSSHRGRQAHHIAAGLGGPPRTRGAPGCAPYLSRQQDRPKGMRILGNPFRKEPQVKLFLSRKPWVRRVPPGALDEIRAAEEESTLWAHELAAALLHLLITPRPDADEQDIFHASGSSRDSLPRQKNLRIYGADGTVPSQRTQTMCRARCRSRRGHFFGPE